MNMIDEKSQEQLNELTDKSKTLLDICDIKRELVAIMLKKITSNNISSEAIERFNNYLNVIVKGNKSSNNLNNRISGILDIVKFHYNNYLQLDAIMSVSNKN